ncbi:Type I phosphodiesterase/nucleotide pyrophosphatase/phosphate transferase [Moorella glycerini]|uniref:Type I phosphodiesterase / nucleotide pyrophosphatase n=1 Tax=Neomoorella stamsii TaxID=1266720 RepID=A0A9X7J4L4_9FIRM|nr:MULTISPECIES: alkaline phosphatase family protein [Moorella]PRR76108.1 Type I phosphodiesterase / nucleotide pyrophosphatase [Moorella stamsii]CEP68286.1 Type I phosphodiesterase/nucleotide pyrophosphatase/phosphate transferase [Moorella glycerini]
MPGPQKLIVIGLDAAVPDIIEDLVARGKLPHFTVLMERGIYSRAYYSIPGVTPVCWASIITGAYPGTHGITDFAVHLPGTPLDQAQNGFMSDLLAAETIWQAAEKVGKRSITINFPSAWPPLTKEGIWVAGLGSPATGSIFEIKSSSCFVGGKAGAATRDSTRIDFNAQGEAHIEIKPDKDFQGEGPKFTLVAHKSAVNGYHKLAIFDAKNRAEAVATLKVGQWSPWFRREFIIKGEVCPGSFRFKLTQMAPDLSSFKLYCSQVMPTDRFTYPQGISEELVANIGPMLENCGTRGFERGWIDEETVLEEAEYKANWLSDAGLYLLNRYDYDLLFLKWHFLDHVQHTFWGRFDPLSPWYNPAEGQKYASLIERAYQIADAVVGKVLTQASAETLVMVVSDHGHTPHMQAMSINNLLAQAGYISWQPSAEDRPIIDWQKTVAYAGPDIGHIFINLKGRDPEGIVQPGEEYEKLQEKIIQLLLDFKDPATGRRPVEIAVKKREAALFGLWGERIGDVFYLMSPGYSCATNWFPLTEDLQVLVPMGPQIRAEGDHGQFKFIAAKFQSVHGNTLPTARLGKGSEQAVFLLAGPGVKKGYRREKPIHLVDIAPTLSLLLGIPAPRNSEGKIIYDGIDME